MAYYLLEAVGSTCGDLAKTTLLCSPSQNEVHLTPEAKLTIDGFGLEIKFRLIQTYVILITTYRKKKNENKIAT